MLKTIFNWFTGKPLPGTTAPDVKPESAPYKVETPQVAPVQAPSPAKCGCGRSESGLCVGLHKLTAEEWAARTAKKPAKAKKAPAKPKAEKKPAAAIKAPAKSRKKST